MSHAYDYREDTGTRLVAPEAAQLKKARFTVQSAIAQDIGRGIVRLDPDDIKRLGFSFGDTVMVIGAVDQETLTYTHARLMPSYPQARGSGAALLDDMQCVNAGAEHGGRIILRKVSAEPCQSVTLRAVKKQGSDAQAISQAVAARHIDNLVFTAGDFVELPSDDGGAVFEVMRTEPKGAVIGSGETQVLIELPEERREKQRETGLESGAAVTFDAGSPAALIGLEPTLTVIERTILAPIRSPHILRRIHGGLPRGVILFGEAGSGKTAIGQFLRKANDVRSIFVSSHQLLAKGGREAVAALRAVFDEAAQAAPAVIFIDDLSALAPEKDAGDTSILAALLAFMESLPPRVTLIGTARSDQPINERLIGGGRFERALVIDRPDRDARRRLFSLFLTQSQLNDDIELEILLERTDNWPRERIIRFMRECSLQALLQMNIYGDKPVRSPRIQADAIDNVLDSGGFNSEAHREGRR